MLCLHRLWRWCYLQVLITTCSFKHLEPVLPIIARVMWYLLLKASSTSQADYVLVHALPPVHLWLHPLCYFYCRCVELSCYHWRVTSSMFCIHFHCNRWQESSAVWRVQYRPGTHEWCLHHWLPHYGIRDFCYWSLNIYSCHLPVHDVCILLVLRANSTAVYCTCIVKIIKYVYAVHVLKPDQETPKAIRQSTKKLTQKKPPQAGLEPTTFCVLGRCSTNWAEPGATKAAQPLILKHAYIIFCCSFEKGQRR